MTKCKDCRFAVELEPQTRTVPPPPKQYDCRVDSPRMLADAHGFASGFRSPNRALWPIVYEDECCGRGEPRASMPQLRDGKMVYDKASGFCWLGSDGMLTPIAAEVTKR